MNFRYCDETDVGFGWIADEVRARTSHALAVDGRVWLIDPVDWHEALERARTLAAVSGVIQLLDRHNRDAAAIAARLGVPHHRVPREASDTPFRFIGIVDRSRWREVALWWDQARVRAVGDALGTLPYFRAGGEPLGVYPWLRLTPPRQLAALEPRHVLCGHGEGVHGDHATAALREALATSRRRAPLAFANGMRFLPLMVKRVVGRG